MVVAGTIFWLRGFIFRIPAPAVGFPVLLPYFAAMAAGKIRFLSHYGSSELKY
jgi:hypothetical protein